MSATLMFPNSEREADDVMMERVRSAWGDPRFYVPLAMLVLSLVTIVWSVARNVATTQISVASFASMQQSLVAIDVKLTEQAKAQAVANANTAKDIEFLKADLAAFRVQYAGDTSLQDTYIKNDRERIIKLEARAGLKGD